MLELIREAEKTLSVVLKPTPLIFSSSLSRLYGFECHLKLENLQKTGSFKARGAYNKLSSLTPEEKRRGVITASSGNHAQGVAWAAALLGVKSTIVMPESSPIVKQVATRAYGGEVVLHGAFFDEAYSHATALAASRSLIFIPPFEDNLVMAGQGAIGLEILSQLPDVDAVVVPIGGGGLISGIASAMKGIKKEVKVIGVQAAASPSCIASLKAGQPVEVRKKATIADGIAVKRVGAMTFAIIKQLVDAVVSVEEETIAAAILQFLERKKLIVEGAGAVTLAAAMEARLPKGIKKAVLVISGGNIDVTMLDRVIRLGLLKEGRLMRIETVLADVPGSLARLTADIAAQKANILHIIHHREAVDTPIGATKVEVILEVEGPQHAGRILKEMKEKGW
ncbi:MAG: threonine ammonia-lyase [Deltaproteobacteria bacterium]|nr:threonine ammonia-lyase [Deltaproteobacteria bacterium]